MAHSDGLKYSMIESWLNLHSEYFSNHGKFNDPALGCDFHSSDGPSYSSSGDSYAENDQGVKEQAPTNHPSDNFRLTNSFISHGIRGDKAPSCSDSSEDDPTQFFDSNSKCFSSKSSRSGFLTSFAGDGLPRPDKEPSGSCQQETRPVVPPPKPPRMNIPPPKPPRRIVKDEQKPQLDSDKKARCFSLSWFLNFFKISSINSFNPTALNSINSEFSSSNPGEASNPGGATSSAPVPKPRVKTETLISSKNIIQSTQVPRPFERTHFGHAAAANDDNVSNVNDDDGSSDIYSEWSVSSSGGGIATPISPNPTFLTPESPKKISMPPGTVRNTPEYFKLKCNPLVIRQIERLNGLEHTRYKLCTETMVKPVSGRRLLSAFDEVADMRTAC